MFECDGLDPASIRLDPHTAAPGAGASSPTDRPLVDGVAPPPLGQRQDGAVLDSAVGGGDDLHLLLIPASPAHNEHGGVN